MKRKQTNEPRHLLTSTVTLVSTKTQQFHITTHIHAHTSVVYYNYMCRNVYIFLFTSISVNLIYQFRMNARPPLYSTRFMNFHDFCYFYIGKFVTLYKQFVNRHIATCDEHSFIFENESHVLFFLLSKYLQIGLRI